jgi:Domain of unknown function (DUF1918)
MRAQPGDYLVVEGSTTEHHARRATILEVRSSDGSPPYLVRWEDGHEGLTFPGPDAHIAPGDSR